MKKKLRSGLAVLALTMLGLTGAHGQSPGGVAADLRIWLKPEGFTRPSWTDASGSGNDFTQTNAERQPFMVPTLGSEKYNFNAFVDFGTTGSTAGFMVVPAGRPYTANGSNSTLFTTTVNRDASGYSDIFGFGATTTGDNLINANNPVLTKQSGNIVIYPYDDNPGLPPVLVNRTYLSDVSYTVGTEGVKYGLNGQTATVNRTFNIGNAQHANGAVLGSQPEVRNGLIGEVVAYERDLTEAEKIRVRSYLAIKYGLTLPHNYVASNGTTIFWNQTTNSGYNNNIAGIAHDAGTMQNQKQSRSVNDGKQVLISTTGLGDANFANEVALNDGQFLVWGDNGLDKAPAVALASASTNFRFAAIWKAQNSGSVGTVRVAWPVGLNNLKLIQSSDETIDNSDPAIDMSANTQTVNGISYNYADVTLANGEFFTFAAYIQAPGGVAANLLMWHKANDGVNTAGAKNIWKDASVNGRDVVQNNNAANQPSLVTDAAYAADSKSYSFNFNPFYYFDGSNDFFYRENDAYFPSPTSPGSTYGVMLNSAVGGWRTPYGWGDDDPNLVRGDNNYLVARDNGVTINENVDLNATPAHLAGMSWKGSGAANNGMYLNMNGRVYSSTNTNVGQTNDANNFAIGSEGFALTGNGNEVYQGGISEVFAYSADHQNSTGDEKQRINSYLAIKYGITLSNDEGTAAANYLSSKSAVVWNATTNTGYNNNIAGIARDENSGLHQKQSFSSNAGPQVIFGTNGLAGTNDANTMIMTDGQFFMWGDNGLEKAPIVAIANFPGLNYRFAAEWKVQNTGALIGVRVAWPAGIPGLQLIQSLDPTFEASDLREDMSKTITLNGVTYNYADVSIGNGDYFTFAANLAGPGGVAAAAWYKADAQGTVFSDAGTTLATDTDQVQQWNEYQGKGYNLLQATEANRPVFSSTTLANFNPTVTFDGSNDFMHFTAGTDVNVIDRASGAIYTSGYINTSQQSGFAGFHATMDYPGLHIFNSNKNLLFFTGGPAWQGISEASMTDKSYFTAGSAWQNGAGTNINYAAATVSLDGTRVEYSDSQLGNVNTGDGARDFRIGADSNTGAFSGQLNEVAVFENRLSEDEMDRVESYLAIKYGTTYASGTRDYKISSSLVVWGHTANNGYHFNIAGIGKDLGGSLDQRQSWSTSQGQQVLIGNNGQLSNTNASHSTPLADGQFLVWGDNGLDKRPTVSVADISGANYRFASIWKVQNTASTGTVRVAWPAGLTSLKLIQSTDETIGGSDPATDMSGNTQTINGIVYNYADVVLANGQYFTFAAFVQAPGGVALPAVWLKANAGTDTSMVAGHVNGWQNFGYSGGIAGQLGQSPGADYDYPYLKNNIHNFNPAIVDSTTNADGGLLLANVFPDYSQRALSSFVLQSQPDVNQQRVMMSFGNNLNFQSSFEYPWFATQSATQLYFWWDGSYQGAPVLPNSLKRYNEIPSINAYYRHKWTSNPDTTTLSMNGATTILTGNSAGSLGIGNHLYINADGGGNNSSGGNISEIVSYDRDLTSVEKQRVNSYLAIKYGVTFLTAGGTEVASYLNSAGDTVWNARIHNGYNNNIAGVANDFNSGLDQKQSRSVNAGEQVLIGTTGLAGTNAANTGTIENGQFLIWGDNGLAKAPGAYNAGLGHGVNLLFKAIWKVQNTDGVGTVRVAWPAGLKNPSLVQSADETFNGSDTFTPMASNNQTINGVTYNYADVTLSNGQYFTFATFIEHAPGGVFAGLTHWYRADIDAVNTGDATDLTSWTDYAAGIVSTQLGSDPLPKFKTGAADYFNFNPGANFTATNQHIGNISLPTLSSLDFDIFTLTKEGMLGDRFFNIGVDNTTFNGDNWDHPGLYANGAIARRNSSNGIVINGGIGGGNPNFAGNAPSIMYHTFTNTSVSKGLNGAVNGNPYSHSAIGEILGGHMFGTTAGTGTGGSNGGFIGSIGETIIYGAGSITTAERNKVDSYLALKYGVTLDKTVNYITSAGDTVWNATDNLDFYTNVAGLGRDNISALHQKQSRSQHANANNQVIIGLGQIAATNAANPGTIADGKFLMWGDNGQTQVMANNSSSYFGFTYNAEVGDENGRRMTRTWKVQNTGMGQEVLIRFPQASVGNTTFPDEACSQFVLLLGDDEGFNSNDYVVPLTLNGTDYEVRHTFPAGVSYFTFAKVNQWAPGIVVLPGAVTSAPDFSTCASNGWNYAKQPASTDKYFAVNGMTTAQLGNLDVAIDPVGAEFSGDIHTRLMPRVTTVTNAGSGTYTGVKVRVYFNQDEMDATIVSAAVKNGWYKFEGDAAAARADISADGLLNPEKTVALMPSGSGVEDGISYVEFDNITTFSSFIYVSTTNETALPVRLVRFAATKKGGSALLTWETAQESDNKGFEIQRGAGNSSWQTVGFVSSQTNDGNSNAQLTYSFSDETPMAGKNYYRLKQIDWDGSSDFSRIVVVDFQVNDKDLVLFPNPVANGALTLELPESGTLEVKIYNLSGIQVKAFRQSSRVLDVKGLSSGKYVLKTVSENGQVYEKTFIVP